MYLKSHTKPGLFELKFSFLQQNLLNQSKTTFFFQFFFSNSLHSHLTFFSQNGNFCFCKTTFESGTNRSKRVSILVSSSEGLSWDRMIRSVDSLMDFVKEIRNWESDSSMYMYSLIREKAISNLSILCSRSTAGEGNSGSLLVDCGLIAPLFCRGVGSQEFQIML